MFEAGLTIERMSVLKLMHNHIVAGKTLPHFHPSITCGESC